MMRIFSIIHKIGITTLVTLNFPTHMYKQTKINNKNLKYYNKKKGIWQVTLFVFHAKVASERGIESRTKIVYPITSI